MRVLFVGHTYRVKVNREKLKELAKYKDVELSVITPKKWHHFLRDITLEKGNENYDLIPLKTLFQGNEPIYFYLHPTLHLNKIKLDIIQVEQGAGALVYLQAIIMKKLFAPKAKMLFFTWWNLPYKPSLIEKINLKYTDCAIVGNEDAKNILVDHGFKNPIKILPQLGVDPKLYKKSDSTELKEKIELHSFVIGYVGRIIEQKGIITLIEAVARIEKDYQLLLVGRGELKDKIVDLATKKGIMGKIHFVDPVPHNKVPDYLNCMDVMVLPSLTTKSWKEQFGHVLIEAMSCEVPVIGSSSAEIPNVIGDAGLIFKEGNSNDLCEKLILLMSDEKLRETLAKKGRERVLQKYTHKKIAEETYKIYQELLE